jgi:hypothetical protein
MGPHGFSNFSTKELASNVGTAPGGGAAPVSIAASSPAVVPTAGKSKDLIHKSNQLTKVQNPLPPASIL